MKFHMANAQNTLIIGRLPHQRLKHDSANTNSRLGSHVYKVYCLVQNIGYAMYYLQPN